MDVLGRISDTPSSSVGFEADEEVTQRFTHASLAPFRRLCDNASVRSVYHASRRVRRVILAEFEMVIEPKCDGMVW